MTDLQSPKPVAFEADARLLTVRQVMAILGISRSTLYALFNEGRIPSVFIRKSRRVRVSDVERFLETLPTDGGECQ